MWDSWKGVKISKGLGMLGPKSLRFCAVDSRTEVKEVIFRVYKLVENGIEFPELKDRHL